MPCINSKRPYVKWSDRKANPTKRGRKPKIVHEPCTELDIRFNLPPDFEWKEPAPRLCRQCGKEVKRGATFCNRSCLGKANIRALKSWEESMAERMREEGWNIFSPTVCCDRIAIKDGQVYFIEFKIKGRSDLRSYQEAVREIVPHMYKVVIGTPDTYSPEVGILSMTGDDRRHHKPKRRGASTSQFNGVGFDARSGKWRARLMVRGKRVSLGAFLTEGEAAKAMEDAMTSIFGRNLM